MTMISIRARVAGAVLRRTRKKSLSTASAAAERINAPKGDPTPPAAVRDSCAVTRRDVTGFTVYTVAPHGATHPAAVLYLHGGAYISEITPQHWAFVARVAQELGCRVEVPIYGLAPQHSYREAYALVRAVYAELTDTVDPARIAIAGDSAGGGLALGVAMSLPQWSLPAPAQVLLLSPWLDLTMANPRSIDVERDDPWLSRVGLIAAGRSWADGDDPNEMALSPINGPLTGLPPVEIYVGTHDVFWPDCRRLRDLAAAEHTPVALHETAGLFHVFALVPFVPEGRAAQDQAVSGLARALTVTPSGTRSAARQHRGALHHPRRRRRHPVPPPRPPRT